MSKNAYSMYIGGEWISAERTFTDYNPANGEVWAEIPDGTIDDAHKANIQTNQSL